MKTLKLIFVLIFSLATLNLYSANTCKVIEKQKVDNTIEKSNHPIKDYFDNMSPKTKKIWRTVGLVLLTLGLTAFSIFCPLGIIALGFGASYPLLWLGLLGLCILISICGGVYLILKKESVVVSIIAAFPVIAGILYSFVWFILALLTMAYWNDLDHLF